MICPVCENVQEAGTECSVCGARLSTAPPLRIDTVPLPDLEPTSVAAAPTVPVTTRDGDAGWLEATAAPPVQVPVEALAVERAAHDGVARERTPPAATACRYCRTPAAPGARFCERCGMSLPVLRRAAAARPDDAASAVRCRSCGTAVTGAACPACGARIARG